MTRTAPRQPPGNIPRDPRRTAAGKLAGSARRRTDAAGTTPDAAVDVLRQFRLVFNAVKAHFRQVEKRAGIGGAQVWALSIVRDKPGIGVSELARRMDIRQSTASNLVRLLVDRELIKVAKGGTDRRTVQLRVLPEGSKVLRKAPAPFSGVLPQALAELDVTMLRRLKRDLGALLAVLSPEQRAAKTPLAEL